MAKSAADLPALLDVLAAAGEPLRPQRRSALEWIYWENAAYLVDDRHREDCYEALRKLTRLEPRLVSRAPRAALDAIAERGGMHPVQRVERWLEIAEIVQDRLGGDLDRALDAPLAQAKKVLRLFPAIGEPGAEKILVCTGRHALPALESNGLRVMQRLGRAPAEGSYAAIYKQAQKALAPVVARGCAALVRAHLLLRRHGQSTCTRTRPECAACVLAKACPSARLLGARRVVS